MEGRGGERLRIYPFFGMQPQLENRDTKEKEDLHVFAPTCITLQSDSIICLSRPLSSILFLSRTHSIIDSSIPSSLS